MHSKIKHTIDRIIGIEESLRTFENACNALNRVLAADWEGVSESEEYYQAKLIELCREIAGKEYSSDLIGKEDPGHPLHKDRRLVFGGDST